MEIRLAQTDDDLLRCREVLLTLRPHLEGEDLLPMLREMIAGGYQLAFVERDGKAVSAIGFRYLQFLFNGRHFYIDDLVTLPEYRGQGFAGQLLDFVADLGRQAGHPTLTLDSGFQRHDAHRLYHNKGFQVKALHFIKEL